MERAAENQEWAVIAQEQESQTDEAIKRLLEGQESPMNTAQRIAQIHEPSIKKRHGRRTLDGLFCRIAGDAQLYEDIRAHRLAHLVIALHALPDCRNIQGEVIEVTGLVVWRDLPEWSYNCGQWTMRVESIYPYPAVGAVEPTNHFSNPTREGDPEKAQDLLNGTIFGAHIFEGLPDGEYNECGGMADYASYALDMALEHLNTSEVDPAAPWRLLIIPATAWVLIAGEKLHQLCHNDLPDSSAVGFSRSRNWARTFCPERWLFWKQAFRQLEEPLELEERHKGAALRAADRMDELDQM